jgi:hypothetical protein
LKCGAEKDRVRNEDVRHTSRVKEERNILDTLKRKKANWIGHILHRNCLLKCVIEKKIERETELMRRRGKRCKHLLDGHKNEMIPEIERGRTRLQSLDNSSWNWLWICPKTNYGMD